MQGKKAIQSSGCTEKPFERKWVKWHLGLWPEKDIWAYHQEASIMRLCLDGLELGNWKLNRGDWLVPFGRSPLLQHHRWGWIESQATSHFQIGLQRHLPKAVSDIFMFLFQSVLIVLNKLSEIYNWQVHLPNCKREIDSGINVD